MAEYGMMDSDPELDEAAHHSDTASEEHEGACCIDEEELKQKVETGDTLLMKVSSVHGGKVYLEPVEERKLMSREEMNDGEAAEKMSPEELENVLPHGER